MTDITASSPYNLEKRTLTFSKNIISFCAKTPHNSITRPIISQRIRSATSIGANYSEANGASSKRDFKNKIHICKKEAIETKYWLRLISHAIPTTKKFTKQLWKEAHEFTLIFSKIIGTINKSQKRNK
jgi:four helix bundle protein